jgi:histidinol-phosphate aminotransferase
MNEPSFRRFRAHLGDLEAQWSGTTAVPEAPKFSGPLAKMDSNENPYPPEIDMPEIAQGLVANRYPDSTMEDLRAKIADLNGVDPECVVVGNGCDEIIDLLIRMTLEPGEAILNCPPTFIMYQRFTEIFGGTVVAVPRDREYQIDVEGIRVACENNPGARLLFLCSPNNPTGTVTPPRLVEKLLDLPLWIIADETYYSFAGKTLAPLLAKSDRFGVVRSFSKGYGLAGLRVGYGLLPKDLARLIRLVRPPYSVNLLAQKAAEEVLDHLDRWEPRFASILSERERLRSALATVPALRVLPSEANFLFCESSRQFKEKLESVLQEEGISIRWLASPYSEAAFRVSVGTQEENGRFLRAVERAAS